MAETGFTPIQLYRTATASAVPAAGNLADGELAINTNDGKLFFKNSGGTVTQIASTGGSTGTVVSVGGTGTVNGISLTGTVTTTGNLVLGGALTGVNLTSQITGILPVANGGTNLSALGSAGQVLAVNSGGSALEYVASSTGSVSSVAMSGGATGLTTAGGPITTAGTFTLAGTLAVASGGTNATTVNAARQSIALPATADVHTSTPATLVDGQYCVAAAGSITFTLPASPAVGDSVIIKDGTGAAATTSFTVARNGSKIASSATDLTFDKNFAEITLTYIDGTIGWSV